MADTITLYPSGVDTANSVYYQISSSYPTTALVGKSANNTTYGCGVNLARNSNAVTKFYVTFDTSSIPEDVNIISVYTKASIYGSTTAYARIASAYIQLCNNLIGVGEQTSWLLSSQSNVTVYPEITDTVNWTRAMLNNIKLLISATRNTSNPTTNTYFYVRGVDLVITYEDAGVYYTVTLNANDHDATLVPANEQYKENSEVTININESVLPKVMFDNVDISSNFIAIMPQVENSFSGAASSSTYTNISSGSQTVEGAVGYTAENPNTANTTNMYSGRNTAVDTAYGQYIFDLSSIPENAINIQVSCKVVGKAETTTYTHQAGGRYCVWGLYCNGSIKGSQVYTTSSSSTIVNFTDTGSWTREELNNLQLRHFVGYYGGVTQGITLTITYEVPGSDIPTGHYYVFTVTANHVIIVGGSQQMIYIKNNGVWKGYTSAYKKINNRWIAQDLSTIFNINENYVKG